MALPTRASTLCATRSRSYLALTKPRLLPLVLFTGAAVLGLAVRRLARAGASRSRAARDRARRRLREYAERLHRARPGRADGAHEDAPAAGRAIAPRAALRFGLALARRLDGAALRGGGPGRGARSASRASLFYVFVYTIWLKPRSAWNAVIGGAAGAAAPLIADAAVNGQRRRGRPRALRDRLLLAAAARLGDRALPQARLRGGRHPDAARRDRRRARRAAACSGTRSALVPVTLAPVALGLLGQIYLAVAIGTTRWFCGTSCGCCASAATPPRGAPSGSRSLYLFSLFLAMLVDGAAALALALGAARLGLGRAALVLEGRRRATRGAVLRSEAALGEPERRVHRHLDDDPRAVRSRQLPAGRTRSVRASRPGSARTQALRSWGAGPPGFLPDAPCC